MDRASNLDPYESYWMPFTDNVGFKAQPFLVTGADGVYYMTEDGRRILDGIAGLWCVNAGHNQPKIVAAIREQAGSLDFVSSFQISHPLAFTLAQRLAAMAPGDLDHAFFVNSGSEAVDTALKIARSYHVARGESSKRRLVGRMKAYHGMGWGGLSVSGLSRHRRDLGPMLGDVDHLRLPYDVTQSRYSRGQPEYGADFALDLEELVRLHDAKTIAAVIVEPVAGAGGVYPPPKGYLEKLRAICDANNILLIFDEVISGFGRLGGAFAAEVFGVIPDIMTLAKGLTNAAVPMGAVLSRREIYATITKANPGQPELPHGYTYSGHPLACAAALASLDVYAEQDLFAQAARLAPTFEHGLHSLRGRPHVTDLRNFGLVGAIDIAPRGTANRAAEVRKACLARDVLVRTAGDTIVLSPPLVISELEIAHLFATIGQALDDVA